MAWGIISRLWTVPGDQEKMLRSKAARCHKPAFHPIISCHRLSTFLPEPLSNSLRKSHHLLPQWSNSIPDSTTHQTRTRAFNHRHSMDLKKLKYTHYTSELNSFVSPHLTCRHATWGDCSRAQQCSTSLKSPQFEVTSGQDVYKGWDSLPKF